MVEAIARSTFQKPPTAPNSWIRRFLGKMASAHRHYLVGENGPHCRNRAQYTGKYLIHCRLNCTWIISGLYTPRRASGPDKRGKWPDPNIHVVATLQAPVCHHFQFSDGPNRYLGTDRFHTNTHTHKQFVLWLHIYKCFPIIDNASRDCLRKFFLDVQSETHSLSS